MPPLPHLCASFTTHCAATERPPHTCAPAHWWCICHFFITQHLGLVKRPCVCAVPPTPRTLPDVPPLSRCHILHRFDPNVPGPNRDLSRATSASSVISHRPFFPLYRNTTSSGAVVMATTTVVPTATAVHGLRLLNPILRLVLLPHSLHCAQWREVGLGTGPVRRSCCSCDCCSFSCCSCSARACMVSQDVLVASSSTSTLCADLLTCSRAR